MGPPPGLNYPQVPSLAAGANSPGNSSYLTMKQQSVSQNTLNQSVSGGRRRRRNKKTRKTRKLRRKLSRKLRGGDSMPATVPVPQFSHPGSTQANAIIAGSSQTSMQAAQNSKYDNLATKQTSGGGRRKKSKRRLN